MKSQILIFWINERVWWKNSSTKICEKIGYYVSINKINLNSFLLKENESIKKVKIYHHKSVQFN
jgi:hypothetical protein